MHKKKLPKVKRAKEMSSKCHLNMVWPLGFLHCIKLCAKCGLNLSKKCSSINRKRSIKICFDIPRSFGETSGEYILCMTQ